MFEKVERKRGFGFVTLPEFVSTQLLGLNGVEFHEKPILIEETRSHPTQSLNFYPRLRTLKIHKIYHLQKNHRRTHHLYHRNKIPTTIIQMLLNQEKKYFFLR